MQARDFKTIAELRVAFPSAFLAGGTINLRGQSGIRTLPSGMVVPGDLILEQCPDLIATPDDLSVSGGLFLIECKALEKVGKAEAGGELQVMICPRVHDISPDLKVRDLSISFCASLSRIPDTVEVDRHVAITFCPELRNVPWEEVRGQFKVTGCVGLSSLPSSFVAEGPIDVSGTRGLELHEDVTSPLIVARNCEGLTVSEGLIERMQGNMDLDGSEYTISTPSADEPAPGPA